MDGKGVWGLRWWCIFEAAKMFLIYLPLSPDYSTRGNPTFYTQKSMGWMRGGRLVSYSVEVQKALKST